MPLIVDSAEIVMAETLLKILGRDIPGNYKDWSRMSLGNPGYKNLLMNMLGPNSLECISTSKLSPEPTPMLSEMINYAYALSRWAAYGYNVFDLTHSLAAAFILTEPPPLSEFAELKSPFPSIRFRIPDGFVPVFKGDRQLWAHRLIFHFYSATEDRTGTAEQEPWLHWRVVDDEGLAVWRERPIKQLWTDREGELMVYNVTPDDPPPVPEDMVTLERSFRILHNFLSWLEATGGMDRHKPLGHGNKRAASVKGGTSDVPSTRTWLFGSEVKLSRELREAASDLSLGHKATRDGWKVRVKHVVRGHWKPNLSAKLGRKVWVEPYWRGPEGKEGWGHLYTTENKP
jgi:hypothetical protein